MKLVQLPNLIVSMATKHSVDAISTLNTMESSITRAIIFGGVTVFILIIFVVAKTCPPPREPKIPKELYPNADAYRRYKRYTFAIVLWVVAVAI
jgi:hypothetical protein